MPQLLPTVCTILLCFVATPWAVAQNGNAPSDTSASPSDPVPEAAVFNQQDLQAGDFQLAGRLTLRRQYLGRRSTPPFQDLVQFNFLDGGELRPLTFNDPQLHKDLKQKLIRSYSLPATIDVQLEEKTVGHDGINIRKRLFGKVSDCKIHTTDALCEAAKSVGSTDAVIKQFKSDLAPEATGNGVMASMGQVFVRSEAARQGSGLSIAGISVFNSNKEPVTIKIKKIWTEQDGDKQQYKMNKRSTSDTWKVAGQSWSDGIYEPNTSPKKLWSFEPDQPIAPESKINVHLELQINDEVVTLKRTVTPQ